MGAGQEVTAQSARRLTLLFFAWSLIYVMPTDLAGALSHGPAGPFKTVYWNLRRAASDPVLTLLTGTEVHLWFLPSLLCSMVITALFVRLDLPRRLLGLAIVLYLVGLAGKAYSATPCGWPTGFNFRNGPFFGLIFFVFGHGLRGRTVSATWFGWGAWLLVLGYRLQFAELSVLRSRYVTPLGQDFVLGTLLVGAGVTLLALSVHHHARHAFLARLGPLTLGVYASHMLFLNLLRPLDAR